MYNGGYGAGYGYGSGSGYGAYGMGAGMGGAGMNPMGMGTGMNPMAGSTIIIQRPRNPNNPIANEMAMLAGSVVKIRAMPSGRAVTCRHENSPMGKRGMIEPREYIGGPNQHWRIENAPMFPGGFKIVQANNPNHVLRFTPAMPNPHEKVCVWTNEPGSPNQVWHKSGEALHPQGHPNMFLHFDPMTGLFTMAMERQPFIIERVM